MIIKLPLTDVQKGILFEITRFKGLNYYVNQELLCFNIGIDVPLMHKAFVQLVKKYEVLRSAIIFESYHPKLTICQSVNLPFEFYDYSSFSNDKKTHLFNSFLEKDFAESIDVTIAPLMRIVIFRLTGTDYRIVWDIHHIIVDGASVSKIVMDLFTIYSALLKDKTYLASNPVFHCKNSDYKITLDSDKAEKYWKQILKNHAISSFLPCSNKKSTVSNKKNSKTIHVCGIDYQQLSRFSNNNSLTLNALLQAAWSIVLFHYSNNENVIFGSVRAYPKDITQSFVGFFINTLPMSFSIDPNMVVIDYLHKVREQSKQLRDYVMVSLNQIHEWSELSAESQIYQSIINYEPFSLNKTLKACFPEIPCEFSSRLDVPYPLVLEIIDDSKSLQLDLYYDEGLFGDEYMRSLLNHYQKILLQVVFNSDKKLAELPAVDDTIFQQVVLEWNNTDVDYPVDKTVHQLFEGQVEKNPNALAVIFKEDILSYRLLNEKANQLANFLVQQGITIEDTIAIWLKPRTEVLICILAILKAGGAYVPVDVNNPSERIKHLLQDSQPKIIITEGVFLDALSDIISPFLIKPLIINVDQPQWDNCSKNNLLVPVQASNLMYIIYTSGSTGKPKGSLIEHFSAVNMALSCSQRLKVTAASRILQIASFSFDVSVAEWCMALLSGASIYLIDRHVFSPKKIVEALKQYKITTIILAHSILASLPETDLPNLKVIASGGEPLSQHTLTYWAKDRLLLNVYGITETSVCSTMSDCSFGKEVVTVGKPLANVQIYVLNKYLQPLPPGVIGEIYIGGLGVGRGYLNSTALTQEKFIDDPFKTDNLRFTNGKSKLYRTGDLGRWVNNGEVEFIGRLDDQVKIRGMRVEIPEIERMLEGYPEIEKGIVVIKELEKSKQLIAYVLPKVHAIIDLIKLRDYLSDHLPVYMIPGEIVQINEMPLTTHGKIDKKKLLAMGDCGVLDIPIDTSISQCETTEKICAIVRNMLEKQNVPIYKNFLDIGLDSIMLVELSMRLSSEFKQPIDTTVLFTYTTIDTLANFIDNSDKFNENGGSFNSIKEFIHKRKNIK